jgi:DNA invertase Pin-like site-specific DNA recombinase
MDSSELYDYDGFRDSRKEEPHVDRLCPERKIHFHSLTDGIDTTTPAGRFFFHFMAS